MRTLTQTLFALAALTIGGIAVAGGPGGPGRAIVRAVMELDLTDTQRTQIRSILDEARNERKAEHEERREVMKTFEDELLSKKPDAAKLHALVDAKAAERQQRLHERIDDMVAISELLTMEQKAELGERLETMREEHRGHREHRRRFED